MANTAQAKKRARQAESHRAHNASLRSALRTSIKRVQKAVESKNKSDAAAALKEAVPMLDRMAGKGLIHKNKAARHKARLNDQVQALA